MNYEMRETFEIALENKTASCAPYLVLNKKKMKQLLDDLKYFEYIANEQPPILYEIEVGSIR